jgi:beta-fructofuranosidase
MIDPVATRRVFTAALLAAAARAGQTPAATREAGVAAATAAVRAAMATAGRDAERPVYHFHPPAQWNNDPNGTIYWRGWHHLFYQLNPYGAEWGHMHWGHARSRNLVDWEHLPVALAPALERGEQHVFSGSAMEAADGRVRILYTSIGDREAEQWMAEPVDDELIAWKHAANNPVVRQSIHGARRVSEWRDPFVFRANGRIYMLCGGNLGALRRGGTGPVQIYEATNGHLDEWRDRGVLFEDRNGQTLNVECPNLVRAGAKWVLITSPHKPCEYFVGDIDWSRYRFVA